MEAKIKAHRYKRRAQFVVDFDLMMGNCRAYNRPDSPIVKDAAKLARQFKRLIANVPVQASTETKGVFA